jgi:hypothetical protein
MEAKETPPRNSQVFTQTEPPMKSLSRHWFLIVLIIANGLVFILTPGGCEKKSEKKIEMPTFTQRT